MTTQIHQLTVNYDPSEDRLMLRVGTSDGGEAQAWLTRRMTLILSPHLPRTLEKQIEVLGLEADPSRKAAHKTGDESGAGRPKPWVSNTDLSQPYRPPVKSLMDGPPLLVTDIDIHPQSDGLTLLVFKERKPEQKGERKLELRLEPQLLQGFIHLISESLPRTEWMMVPAEVPREDPVLAQVPPKHLLN
jgi:hypothetical protein